MDALVIDDVGFGSEDARIAWADLVAVGIKTTADGPWTEDVFWMVHLRDGAVLELPGYLVTSDLLSAFQKKLRGFDNVKLVAAMGSTNERWFRVWHVDERVPDAATMEARFAALVERLGGDPSGAAPIHVKLRAAWGAQERRYHDLEHLADCLRELDRAQVDPSLAAVVELALWYHDAVYIPGARDSEEQSAQLLCADAAALRLPRETVERAAALVRSTAHDVARGEGDPASDLIADIDLSILGRDVLRFMEFEFAIEEEFAAVRSLWFIVLRGRFLASLLRRPAIFRTELFRDRYEAAARCSVGALLRSPRYRAWRWLRWVPV